MNSLASDRRLAFVSITAALMMSIPFATWAFAVAPGVGVVLAGVFLLLGAVSGLLVLVLLPTPIGNLRKLVVSGPAFLSVAMAVATIASLRAGGPNAIIFTGFGLSYAMIMSSAMQIAAWHTGLRGVKPNWIKASFSLQAQDPGRPYKDPLPGAIIVGGSLVAIAGIASPLAAASGLGVFMLFAVATSVSGGAGRLHSEHKDAEGKGPHVSIKGFFPFAMGVSLAAAAVVSLLGLALSSPGRPLLGGATSLASMMGASGQGQGASPALASPPPAIPQWLILLVVALVMIALARTAKLWMPLVQRFFAFLWAPIAGLLQRRRLRREAIFAERKRREIEAKAATYVSPFASPPADSQALLDGTEYVLACFGLTCRLHDGLRTVYRAATRIGLPEASLRPLFQHLERTAYLAPEAPSERVLEAFQALTHHVKDSVASETLSGREAQYRIERATRELSPPPNAAVNDVVDA